MIIVGPIAIVAANMLVYLILGKLGRRSVGTGNKYSPFTGGEKEIPERGTYHSELFVFATLFLVVEMFALLLAGAYSASSNYYDLLFLVGGGTPIIITILWFLKIGGGIPRG